MLDQMKDYIKLIESDAVKPLGRTQIHFTSYDVKKVLVQLQTARKSWEKNFSIWYSNALRVTDTTVGCQEFERYAQSFLARSYKDLRCYWSKLFIPRVVEIDPNKDAGHMQDDAIRLLNTQIDCSNELLPEESRAKDDIRLDMEARIRSAGDNRQAIKRAAERFLVDHLNGQLAVRTHNDFISFRHSFKSPTLFLVSEIHNQSEYVSFIKNRLESHCN